MAPACHACAKPISHTPLPLFPVSTPSLQKHSLVISYCFTMAIAPRLFAHPVLPSPLSLHPSASSSSTPTHYSALRLTPLVAMRNYPCLHSGCGRYCYDWLREPCFCKLRWKDLAGSRLLDSGGVGAPFVLGLVSPAHAMGASRLKVDAKASGRTTRFRRRRRLRRVDPQLEERKRVPMMQCLEQHKRLHKETGRQVLVDVDQLLNQCNNRFGLVLDIAEQATEYLENNPEEALIKKPILKAISDKINEGAGMKLSDAYVDDGFGEWQETIY